MSRSALLASAFLLIVLLGPAAIAVAQEGTPVATPPAGVIVPDPSECDVEPRPIEYFEQLIASPPAMPTDVEERFSPPGMEPRPWIMPAGEPADDATIAEVTSTLNEAMACLNGNDTLRFLALFSDDMLNVFFALEPLPPEALPQLAATPVASPPELHLGYLPLSDVRVLPDGRVAALGDNYDPTQPPFGMGTDFAILVKVGDRWLIDTLIENVEIVGEPTPTAQDEYEY